MKSVHHTKVASCVSIWIGIFRPEVTLAALSALTCLTIQAAVMTEPAEMAMKNRWASCNFLTLTFNN